MMVTYLFSIKRSLLSFLLLYSFCLIMASAILFGISHLRVWCCPLSVCLLGFVPSPSADSVWLMYGSCWQWFLLTYGLRWTEAPTEPRLLLTCGLYWLMPMLTQGFYRSRVLLGPWLLLTPFSWWSMDPSELWLLLTHGNYWLMTPAELWPLLIHASCWLMSSDET